MVGIDHGPHCKVPYSRACAQFSTDGTRLGADIAHQFGTTDEDEIANMDEFGIPLATKNLTGMDQEQREWEGLDDAAEAGDDEDQGV